MSKQPKDQSATQPQLHAGDLTGYPVNDQHKAKLKHPTPGWWPTTAAKRLELGHRVSDAINSIAEELAYDITNNLVANIRAGVADIEKIQNWRLALHALAQEYTDVLDFAYNGPAFVGADNAVFITKLDNNAVATLGPVTANLSLFSGLLGLLIQLEAELNTVTAYRVNQDYGIRLGFITAAAAKPDLAAQVFEFTGHRLLNGQPAVEWLKGPNAGAVFNYRELTGDDAHWHPAGTYLSSPSPLAIPAHPRPRVVEVQGRYLKGNQQVGAWSRPGQLTIPAAEE